MQFSWLTALWKGVRDAILAYLPTLVAGLVAAALGALGPDQLVSYGVPLWVVPLLIGLFTYVRNILRNRFKLPV